MKRQIKASEHKNRVVSVSFDILMPYEGTIQGNKKFMEALKKACRDQGYECLTDSDWDISVEDVSEYYVDSGYLDD